MEPAGRLETDSIDAVLYHVFQGEVEPQTRGPDEAPKTRPGTLDQVRILVASDQ